MQWERLLSLRKYKDVEERLRKDESPTRVGFEVDYDRIIFSNAFRSLQDKTQVVPLSKTDFVHTRLTHSLEVSVVGRSLGRLVGERVLEKYPQLKDLGYTINDFGSIVASASLCHDIGNPPFGHSGEKAIGDFFRMGAGQKYKPMLSEKEWQDLIDFEGNANGFHILTHSSSGNVGGLRISYATLGAFMKYPKESLPVKPSKDISDKKYGFFQADKEVFEDVAEQLGLIDKERKYMAYFRHPLAYLVEAADDICYTIIDFEDGINLGWIDEEKGFELLKELVPNINREKYEAQDSKQQRMSYLRALAIGTLIQEAVEVFMTHEEEILSGVFSTSLVSKSKYHEQIEKIIQISVEKVYKHTHVIEKEIRGYKVLHALLEQFIEASNNKYNGCATHFDEMILKILPEQFRQQSGSLYLRLLNICSFVSLLTDGKALEIYHSLK